MKTRLSSRLQSYTSACKLKVWGAWLSLLVKLVNSSVHGTFNSDYKSTILDNTVGTLCHNILEFQFPGLHGTSAPPSKCCAERVTVCCEQDNCGQHCEGERGIPTSVVQDFREDWCEEYSIGEKPQYPSVGISSYLLSWLQIFRRNWKILQPRPPPPARRMLLPLTKPPAPPVIYRANHKTFTEHDINIKMKMYDIQGYWSNIIQGVSGNTKYGTNT